MRSNVGFRKWLVIVAIAAIMAAFVPESRADDAPNPIPSIMADWQRLRTRWPRTKYRMSGTRRWMQGAFKAYPTDDPTIPPVPDNPEKDLAAPFTRSVMFDFVTNQHRLEWDDPEYQNLERTLFRIRCVNGSDGKVNWSEILENSDPLLQTGPKKRHVDLLINRGFVPVGVMDLRVLPLMFAHGIVALGKTRVRPTMLLPSLDPKEFEFKGYAQENGRRFTLLHTTDGSNGLLEYWVDQERDSTVRRVIASPGNPLWKVDVDYKRGASGWLVGAWSKREFAVEDRKLRIAEDVLVEQIDESPVIDEADFAVPLKAGLYVQDVTYQFNPKNGQFTSDTRFYLTEAQDRRIPLDGRLLPVGDQAKPGWRWWIVWINVFAILLGISYAIFRRFQTKKTAEISEPPDIAKKQ